MENTKEKPVTSSRPATHHAREPAAMGWLEWTASYGTGAVVGLASAVHSIRHKFYDDVKSWKIIREIREKRDEQFQAIEGTASNPKSFREFHPGTKVIEMEYTKDLNRRLKYACGIESEGLKGLTVGTWQRWCSMGPHSRQAAAFSLVTGAAISIGAILTIKNRRLIAQLDNRSDEQGHTGRGI